MVKILRLTPFDKSGITYYSSIFDRILEKEGIKIVKAKYLFKNFCTWWLPFDFILRRKYWENILKEADAVHAEIGMHQAREILTIFYLKRMKKDLKVFMTIHDPSADKYRIFKIYCNFTGSLFSKILNKIAYKIESLIDRLFFTKIINHIFKQADLVFVFNQWGVENLSAKYSLAIEKIKIINHLIYNYPKQTIEKIAGRKLVFAGFWSENKGIETLISAYSLLRKKFSIGIPKLIISGDTQISNSSYAQKIKKLTLSLKLENFIEFPGFLSEDEMFKMLSKGFLVLPYTDKISGSASGVYIMGLQTGAVTIVANNPTLSHFAENNNISLVFKQGDAEDLCNKMIKAIRNKEFSYRLAKKGQDYIFKYGNWNELGKKMNSIYTEYLPKTNT